MRSMAEDLVMEGRLNGSQVRLGVKSDHVEHCNASRYDVEYYSEDVVNPCHLVVIHGTTADGKQL